MENMTQGQKPEGNFYKPFLSEADETPDGSGNRSMASRNTCLIIEKDSCKIYARCKYHTRHTQHR